LPWFVPGIEPGALLRAEFRKTEIIAGFNDRGKHLAKLTMGTGQENSRNKDRFIFFLKIIQRLHLSRLMPLC
jgi:hypothetical protein